MTSIGSYLIPFLFALITIIYINPLTLFNTSSSTCPNNNDSICNTLPFNINNPSDVWLNVPSLSVDEISLVVEDLKAHVSLSANVANLVSFNTGVDVSVGKINLTMTGIKAQVQLAVHLDNAVKIITRTLASLDLNPFLLSMIDNISDKSSNLLGTLIDNGRFIHQIINKVGKIINQVLGPENEILSATIVGDYRQNMTFTGISKTLVNGYIINQYSYLSPSISSKLENILINIVFDTHGNILNTNVLNPPTNTACNSRKNVGK